MATNSLKARSRAGQPRFGHIRAFLDRLRLLGATLLFSLLTVALLVVPEWTRDTLMSIAPHLGFNAESHGVRGSYRIHSTTSRLGTRCEDGCPKCDRERVIAQLRTPSNRTRSIEPEAKRRMHGLDPRRALLHQGGMLLFTHLRRTGGSSLVVVVGF